MSVTVVRVVWPFFICLKRHQAFVGREVQGLGPQVQSRKIFFCTCALMYINSCYINRFSYLVELLLLHFHILFVSHFYYLFPFVVVMIDEIVKYIIYFLIFRLTFQFSPSSKVYGFSEVDLVRNGGDQVCVEKTGDGIKNVGLSGRNELVRGEVVLAAP